MNQLYAKFVSCKESTPTCCPAAKNKFVKCSNFQGFIRVSSDSEEEKILPWQRDVQQLPFYDWLLFNSRKSIGRWRKKLEYKSKYSNYHMVPTSTDSSLPIFSLYDADLKNYFFLKKEHGLVQWRRGKEHVLDWLITQLTERKLNARLSRSYAHLLNPQSLNIRDLIHHYPSVLC